LEQTGGQGLVAMKIKDADRRGHLMMHIYSAHSLLVDEVSKSVGKVLSEIGIKADPVSAIERAPPDRGDLTVNVYRLARDESRAAQLAALLVSELNRNARFVGEARSEGGYVNVEVNPDTYGSLCGAWFLRWGESTVLTLIPDL
jgi:Arginyl tRNA synthetase N terminal domain.